MTDNKDSPDSGADGIVSAFISMRERCQHYKGFKETHENLQCLHPDNENGGAWCSMSECPRIRAKAEHHGVWQ